MDESVKALVNAELRRWLLASPIRPSQVHALVTSLEAQGVEIGEVGAMCAVLGFLTGAGIGRIPKR